MKQALLKALHPIRLAARRFLMLPDIEKSYIGQHGCLRTAAQFVTWNQIPGDYFEFGVYQGESFAAAYHAIWTLRERHSRCGLSSLEASSWEEVFPPMAGRRPRDESRAAMSNLSRRSCRNPS